MQLFHDLDDPKIPQGGYLSIGNFDGVHRGHRMLLERLVTQARAAEQPSLVLTFDPPPAKLLAPLRCPPQLTEAEDRARLMGESGVDVVVIYPTDAALLNLSPREFFEDIVVARLRARGMVEGPNFCFGKDRAGTVEVLRELCTERGMSLDVVPPAEVDGELVSSSAVRQALRQGDISRVTALLGRGYRVSGTVVSGAKRGRTLGFPTANVVDVKTMLPGEGVYAGRCRINHQDYAAAIHLGPNPTFAEGEQKLEIHLLGFTGNLYGSKLSVEFLERVRDIRQFNNSEAIQEQIRRDLSEVQRLVEREGPSRPRG